MGRDGEFRKTGGMDRVDLGVVMRYMEVEENSQKNLRQQGNVLAQECKWNYLKWVW